MTLYCPEPECFNVEAKWVCCGGNDTYGHLCMDSRNHCYIQCPKCNKTYRLSGIYYTYSTFLEKEKEKRKNLKEKINELEKENSSLKEEEKKRIDEFNSAKNKLEEKINELEKKANNESESKKEVEIKNNEIKNLKIQFEKDLKIKELEYQIQINNIKNEYNNKSNIEKELNELKQEIQELKSKKEFLKKNIKENENELKDKEIELRCYSNENKNFYFTKTVYLSDLFNIFINCLMNENSINIKDYIFTYDGKEIDKSKSLRENGILNNTIVIMKKITEDK